MDRIAEYVGEMWKEINGVGFDKDERSMRSPSAIWSKARAGEIKNFTGIDSPYEIPNKPNLIVDTEKESVSESVDKIFSAISNKIK